MTGIAVGVRSLANRALAAIVGVTRVPSGGSVVRVRIVIQPVPALAGSV
jgi:hypothetical protein